MAYFFFPEDVIGGDGLSMTEAGEMDIFWEWLGKGLYEFYVEYWLWRVSISVIFF